MTGAPAATVCIASLFLLRQRGKRGGELRVFLGRDRREAGRRLIRERRFDIRRGADARKAFALRPVSYTHLTLPTN